MYSESSPCPIESLQKAAYSHMFGRAYDRSANGRERKGHRVHVGANLVDPTDVAARQRRSCCGVAYR
jgi:hypothetical protein